MLWRSTLRSDCAVVLALGSRPELAALTSFATLKHAGRSQFWMRAARADAKPALLVAPEIAPTRPHRVPPAALQPLVSFDPNNQGSNSPRCLAVGRPLGTQHDVGTRVGLPTKSITVATRQALRAGARRGRFL